MSDTATQPYVDEPTAQAVAALASPTQATPLPADRFADRELSWLSFNERVLELAEDESLPLLERAKFLAIFASNLDEFFMVRVAGLKRRIDAGIAVRAASGLMPRDLLELILSRTRLLMDRHATCFGDSVLPGLRAEGIQLLRYNQANDDERALLQRTFAEKVFPVLTPLAVDPAHPFPYISGLSLNLAVVVRNPGTGTELFARVKVPQSLPRFLQVGPERFVPLEDVIAANLSDLFPGMDILQQHSFRVTRNEDVEVEEDDAENLLKALERELNRRRFGPPVRLEVERSIDPYVLELLVRELGISEEEVFSLPGPLDLTGLWTIIGLDRQDLKEAAFLPKTSPQLSDVETAAPPDVLEAMRDHDVLLHHPYDSFSTSVQRFLEQAAADPKVLAIKQTLYRTSGDSPIVDALIDAAQAGKQVLALVEIKARFDERANISWARKLERQGVHVVYGLVGLKTHCKLSMVVRDDGERLRRYVHIGTGNYHPKTARLYEDMGLLTDRPGRGRGRLQRVQRAVRLLDEHHVQPAAGGAALDPHRPGRADRAGSRPPSGRPPGPGAVQVQLDRRRGHHRRPVPGLAGRGPGRHLGPRHLRGATGGAGTERQHPGALGAGRFLEHSRAYEFANGGDTETWIGSADLMHRNLDRRVEALVRLGTEHAAQVSGLIDMGFDDSTKAWIGQPDGSWTPHTTDSDGRPCRDLQEHLIGSGPPDPGARRRADGLFTFG